MPSDSSSVSQSQITPRLLTVKQASAYAGCTIWHVRELFWSKTILGFKAGRRLLIERTSLDAYIDRKLAERAQ
jgi:excisionase family DNA binding protein